MIYFDNSATTAVSSEVYEAMIPYLTSSFGNPSSKYYALAVDARKAVENSRYWVAQLIHAKPEEIIFTGGATESTNFIIKGVADYKRYYEHKGNHIITTKAEHHATLHTCQYLNGDIYSNRDATFSLNQTHKKVDRGYEVTFLDVNPYGQVEVECFERAIRSTTTLASFLWANNEIGSLNNIPALAKAAHKHTIPLHVDATQCAGKVPINVQEVPIDFMSFSAHKFHGPKGIGAAYIRSDEYGLPPITSLLHGGEQEGGIRAGTLAVPNIVGFGKAAELACRDQEARIKKLEALDQSVRALITQNTKLELLGDPENHVPGIISIIIHDAAFDNERFIKRISQLFAVSSGSACTAGAPSHVLQAIGRQDDVSRVLRLSLSEADNVEDIRLFLQNLI